MIFTRHAFQRYRQFHMMDQPTATDEDARDILERFGPTAKQVGVTYRGDPVWCIEELGIELVAKHEDGIVTCVTVLPPARFRGLTPLQAEAVAESAREAKARADEAQRKIIEAKAALVEHNAAERAIETAGRNARRVENVAVAMSNNHVWGKPSSLLIDIGAPLRDPCTCGNSFHDRGCPQANTFPRIGRLAIYLERVDKFIKTMQAAKTSTERIFVP